MIGNDWDNELSVIWNSPNFNKFYNNILKLYDKETIYPEKDNSISESCSDESLLENENYDFAKKER